MWDVGRPYANSDSKHGIVATWAAEKAGVDQIYFSFFLYFSSSHKGPSTVFAQHVFAGHRIQFIFIFSFPFPIMNGSGELQTTTYICMVPHIARVWINRVRLPILHEVS